MPGTAKSLILNHSLTSVPSDSAEVGNTCGKAVEAGACDKKICAKPFEDAFEVLSAKAGHTT